jgi:hypothetical protein
MCLCIAGLQKPNRVLSDFSIFLGSLLCPIFNEHGFIRVWTDARRERIYAAKAVSEYI